MPRRHVEAEHHPQQPELGGADRVARRDVEPACEHTLGGRRPARGPPSVGGHPDEQPTRGHEHGVDQAHHEEGLPDPGRRRGLARATERGQQLGGQRRRDERAPAEAHDRDPGGETRPVGEPLDQRGHRRDVADAQPDATDEPIADHHQPELAEVAAEGGDQEARDEARRGDEHGPPRPVGVDAGAEERGREAQHDDAELERQRREDARVGIVRQHRGGERGLEHAPGVGLADREVDRQRRRWNQPATPSRRRDRPLPSKKSGGHCRSPASAIVGDRKVSR